MENVPCSPAALMCNSVEHRQFTELCELLGGFRNEHWVQLVFGGGEPEVVLDGVTFNGRTVGYGLCRRVVFDLDWETYVLTQVWDHGAELRAWEFVLLFNSAANQWVPEQVYSWGARCPSYTEAGAVVDRLQLLRYER